MPSVAVCQHNCWQPFTQPLPSPCLSVSDVCVSRSGQLHQPPAPGLLGVLRGAPLLHRGHGTQWSREMGQGGESTSLALEAEFQISSNFISPDQVRKSTAAPVVLAHTRCDEAARLDMRRTCRACERLGAAGWETTSASSGQNVSTVFDLCVAAAMESNVKSDNKKDRLVRPNTLQLSSMVSNLGSHKNNKTWQDKTRSGNNNTTKYSEHVYENPEEIDRTLTSTVTDLSGTKLKKRNVNTNFVIPGRGQFCAGSPRDWSAVRGHCDDTRNLEGLGAGVDQSVFSPQSSKSCLKSPTLSDLDGVPMR